MGGGESGWMGLNIVQARWKGLRMAGPTRLGWGQGWVGGVNDR